MPVYLIHAGVGWVSLARLRCLFCLDVCLYAFVNHSQSAFMLFRPQAVCLTSLYRFHVVQAACKPFS